MVGHLCVYNKLPINFITFDLDCEHRKSFALFMILKFIFKHKSLRVDSIQKFLHILLLSFMTDATIKVHPLAGILISGKFL